MQSGASTPRAEGRPRRSSPSFSLTRGGPSSDVLQPIAERLGEVDLDHGRGRRSRRRGERRAAPGGDASGPAPVAATDPPPARRLHRLIRASAPATTGGHGRPGDRWSDPRTSGPGELCRRVDACCMVPVHIIIVGCGRVGSGLGVELAGAGPLGGHHRPEPQGLPPAARRLARDHGGRVGLRPGRPRRRPGRASAVGARRRDQRRQLQHPDARIARETYGIPNVVARIYDPRRAQIYLRLGIATVATVSWTIDQVPPPAAARTSWRPSGPTRRERSRSSSGTCPSAWAGKRLADLSVPGRGDAGVGHPGRCRPTRLHRPGGPGRRHPPPDGHRRRAAAASSSA